MLLSPVRRLSICDRSRRDWSLLVPAGWFGPPSSMIWRAACKPRNRCSLRHSSRSQRSRSASACRERCSAVRHRLTRQIEELMPKWSMAPVAAALQALRGVALVVAVTVVAEVGDFRRFTNARQLMAYLGLVPSEHSSGSTVRRAGITKAGNALARRVLIEGAWTYRMSARVSRKLHDRLEPLSAAIRDIAWKAQVRLCARYRRLVAIGKPKVVVTTAIAREMVGFIWAIARVAQPELFCQGR